MPATCTTQQNQSNKKCDLPNEHHDVPAKQSKRRWRNRCADVQCTSQSKTPGLQRMAPKHSPSLHAEKRDRLIDKLIIRTRLGSICADTAKKMCWPAHGASCVSACCSRTQIEGCRVSSGYPAQGKTQGHLRVQKCSIQVRLFHLCLGCFDGSCQLGGVVPIHRGVDLHSIAV